MNVATGAMQQFDRPGSPNGGAAVAGLVLLYAEDFASLPAAWPLPRQRSVVGREAPADIVIAVNAVSRVHAEFVWERGGFTLRDLGSTNGTLLDGRQVKEARLESGQELRFGDAIVKFVDAEADAHAHYRIDGHCEARLATQNSQFLGGYQLDRIASELARVGPTELTVMLLGESGTGKEVVANDLHQRSGRSGAFRAVNCAAIPDNLIESELFGYKRGAFSGADRDKPGIIQSANEGTLLLDEIGDMPLAAQAKLLRVLQSREVFPVGANKPEPVDVRVVCATHRDLKKMQDDQLFRPDLYARLNEYVLRLPALRDRKEDIYLLFRAFLDRQGHGDLNPSFSFMTALVHYDWPYNVRELVSCVKRCVALATTKTLGTEHLPEPIQTEMSDYGRPAPGAPSEHDPKRTPTAEELHQLLLRHQGNVAAVGRELGKARMQVHRWLKKYELELEHYRATEQ